MFRIKMCLGLLLASSLTVFAQDYSVPQGIPAYSTPYAASPGMAVSSGLGWETPTNGAATTGWPPGGYEARMGMPYHYYGGDYVVTGNPYNDHFGPGFHRNSLHGHYRFPYYSYRAPWYYPGRAVYNRDTNFVW